MPFHKQQGVYFGGCGVNTTVLNVHFNNSTQK